jgi:lipoprotein-anchoring transpeptidase ErfK/SrfK
MLDKDKLHSFVEKITSEQAEAPIDASVVITNGQSTVLPDKNGLGVDKDTLVSLLQQGVNAQTVSLEVHRSPVQADIQVTTADQSAAEATAIMATPITLTYNGQTFTPTPAQIGSWLTFTKTDTGTLAIGFDTTLMKAYTATAAKGINVAAVNEQVSVVNGVVQGNTPGTNGLAVDQDGLVKAMTANLTTHTAGGIAITTSPIAFKTTYNRTTDLGSGKYVEINLSTQHLWAYDNNQVVFDSPITSGAVYYGLGTPTGMFAVYYKTTDFWMDGRHEPFPYYVHVDYWMPFDGGVGMHDASWRSAFGGQDYYSDGSHGCINMPHDAAAWMYNFADIGTPVWVHQ